MSNPEFNEVSSQNDTYEIWQKMADEVLSCDVYSNPDWSTLEDDSSVLDALDVSKPMIDFFRANGYKTNEFGSLELPKGLTRKLLDPNDAIRISREFNSAESNPGQIYVGDVVGSQAVRGNKTTLVDFMSYLYHDYYDGMSSTYGNRSTEWLKGNYKETANDILGKIGPLKIASDGEHHVLCGDGNHRLFFLATTLELELAECDDENKKAEIRQRYTLPADIYLSNKFPEDIEEKLSADPPDFDEYDGDFV